MSHQCFVGSLSRVGSCHNADRAAYRVKQGTGNNGKPYNLSQYLRRNLSQYPGHCRVSAYAGVSASVFVLVCVALVAVDSVAYGAGMPRTIGRGAAIVFRSRCVATGYGVFESSKSRRGLAAPGRPPFDAWVVIHRFPSEHLW
jgi:hypothetical protein